MIGIKNINGRPFHSGGIIISTKNNRKYWCKCGFCDSHKQPSFNSGVEEQVQKNLAKKEERLVDLKFNFYDISDELLTVMLSKNADYGPDNILNSPGGAINGLNVRLFDKVARLNNLISNNKVPNNESVRDTLIDIANYAIIGLLVTDNNWK